jgi:hypothetical protein
MTTAKINKAIAFLKMEIVRNDGWQYFLDLDTGNQVGGSVWVCHLNHLPLDQWISEARTRWIVREANARDMPTGAIREALEAHGTADAARAYLDKLELPATAPDAYQAIVALASAGHSVEIVPLRLAFNGTPTAVSVKVAGLGFMAAAPINELAELLSSALEKFQSETESHK